MKYTQRNPHLEDPADTQRSDGWMRRLVMPILRYLLMLVVLTLAMAAHNLWFGIGSRGIPQAVMDGAFLAMLVMPGVWIYGLISRHNAGHLAPPPVTPENHE